MLKLTKPFIAAALISCPIVLNGENTQDYYYEEKSFDEEHHIPTSNLPNPNTEQGQLELWKESQDSRDDLRDIYPDPKAREKKYKQQMSRRNNNQNNNNNTGNNYNNRNNYNTGYNNNNYNNNVNNNSNSNTSYNYNNSNSSGNNSRQNNAGNGPY